MLALVLTVPFMGQTASATGGGISGAVQNFFEWSVSTGDQVENGFWTAIYGDSWMEGENPPETAPWVGASREELTQKLDTYNETLETDTGTDSLGGSVATDSQPARQYIRHYYEFISEPWEVVDDGSYSTIALSLNVGDINPVAIGNYVIEDDVASSWARISLPSANANKFLVPASGKIRLGSTWVATGAPTYNCIEPSGIASENSWQTAITGSQHGPGTREWRYTQTIITDQQGGNTNVGADVWVYMDYAPTDGVSALTTLNVTEESRAGSIQGTTTTSSGTTYYDYSVVNNNTYTSPLTGEQKPISEWQYDYVERQYNLVCEDGSEVKVVYGDENMTVQEGDTIETVYYGDTSGSDSGGDSEGGFGQIIADSLSAIGEFIGGLIAGILSIVASAVEALGGLLDIFNGILDTIKGFFGGFTDFLASLFPFLPEETFDILNFGLILFIASAVIRKMFF